MNAKLHITMNRSTGSISVDDTSTKVFTRDASVDVKVTGFESGEAELAPYLRLLDRGVVLAECALAAGDTDGVFEGTISTNTAQMVYLFGGIAKEACRTVTCTVLASAEANPFASGLIQVWNFPISGGDVPAELPSASEVLAATKAELLEKITAEETAREAADSKLSGMIKSESETREAKDTELDAALTAHTGNSNIHVTTTDKQNWNAKANAVDVYTKTVIDEIVAALKIKPLVGLKFYTPKSLRQMLATLAYVVQKLGGSICDNGDIVSPEDAPEAIYIKDADGTTHEITVVSVEGENTLEVD